MRRDDPGKRGDALPQRREQPLTRGQRLGRRSGDAHTSRHDTLRIEPGLDSGEPEEAPANECGSNEKDSGECKLQHDQAVLQSMAGASHGKAPRIPTRRLSECITSGLQRRHETADQTAGDRRTRREQEHRAINRRLVQPRKLARAEVQHESEQPIRDQHTGDPSA